MAERRPTCSSPLVLIGKGIKRLTGPFLRGTVQAVENPKPPECDQIPTVQARKRWVCAGGNTGQLMRRRQTAKSLDVTLESKWFLLEQNFRRKDFTETGVEQKKEVTLSSLPPKLVSSSSNSPGERKPGEVHVILDGEGDDESNKAGA